MTHSSALILDSIFYKVPQLSILEGVYLKVIPGKVTALIGRNGAGKSTLLKIAAGQLSAGSGITIIDGERLHERALNKRFHKIGYLPQDSMLPDDISVQRLISAIPMAEKLKDEPFIQSLMMRKISKLSGGERRYLEFSILLSLNRDYILLDEPFSGIEPFIIDQIIHLIKKEKEYGRGILLTDHMYRHIARIADEAYLLRDKQCQKLGDKFIEELKETGYLRG